MSALHATDVSDASTDAEMTPKYPHINVEMVGEDGNAFSIIGRCLREMSRAGCAQEQRDEFQKEVTAGDYDHVLQTVIKYFNVDSEEDELDEEELFESTEEDDEDETEDEIVDLDEAEEELAEVEDNEEV